eukprot:m51a1_g7934 hypothetical protein (1490) ;mRNA; r:55807-61381
MCLLQLFSLLALALASPARGQSWESTTEWPSTRLADLVPGSASGSRGHAVPLPDAPVRLYDAGTTAPAGDVDGDGAVDVVAAGCGAVHVVLGPVGASVALPRAVAEGLALRIDAPRCPCGAKVTVESAGDVNCDGVGDVAVVCAVRGGFPAAYVLLGRRRPAPWPSSLDDRGPRALVVALAGPVARVAAVGDVNGDNCTDVAVALRPSARSVSVVYGRPTAQWPPVLDVERLGPSEGFAVPGVSTFAGVGDVDGDAVDDVVLGDPDRHVSGRRRCGAAFLVFGRPAFPQELDTGTAEGVVAIVGEVAGDRAGQAVGAAGDVDGDGHGDFAVCLRPSGDPALSRYLLVFGGARASWPRTAVAGATEGLPRWSLVAQHRALFDYFPPVVSAGPAGDINGDGFGDVALCAQDLSSPMACAVVFGSNSSWPRHVNTSHETNAVQILVIRAPAYSGTCGRYAGPLGDIDGDGVDDLLLGAPEAADLTDSLRVGNSYVVRGRSASSLFPSELALSEDIERQSFGYVLAGGSDAPMAGASVSGVGDMDNDTFGDFAVGAPGAGRVYLVLGSAADREVATRVTIESGEAGDLLGWSVSSAGDVNGDRVPDLIAGAPRAAGGAGRAYVVFGRSGGWGAGAVLRVGALDGTSGFAIAGDAGAGGLGFAVSAAGDVNGDGIDDVLVGAVQTRRPLSASDVMATAKGPLLIVGGGNYALLGRSQWPRSVSVTAVNGTDGFVVDGAVPQLSEASVASIALTGVGDVNGDGFDDFAVGIADHNWTVHVVFGRAAWGPLLSVRSLDGTSGFTLRHGMSRSSSLSVAGVGDVDGDGVGDLAVGTLSGSCYVLFGRGVWPAVSDPSRLDLVSELYYGNVRQVASADVNGDGLSDVVCLCAAAGTNSARVLVTLGSTLWMPYSGSVRLASDIVVSGDGVMHLHGSVSSAGDRDGDGVDDLVIGTVEHRNGTGRAWVVYGSRAPRVVRPIQDCPGCCRAKIGARYAFTVPADTCAQDSDPAPLALNASWSAVTEDYRTYSSEWLSFDNATGSFSGGPTHTGSLRVKVSCTNARGVRTWQTFSLYVASSVEVSIGDNSGKATFGGEKSGETQLAPIVVDCTGSRVQVSITADAQSLRSREHSDDVAVSQAEGTWRANGTVAGVNRVLSRLVFGHCWTQDSVDFTLRAEDDLGGSCTVEWSATRDARDRDDPSSAYAYFIFLAIGLPVAAGAVVLSLGISASLFCSGGAHAEHYASLLAGVYTWFATGGGPSAASSSAEAFDRRAAEYAELLCRAGVASPAPRGAVAVDLGAGSGLQTLPLARMGYRVAALDTSAALLAELASHAARLGLSGLVTSHCADVARVGELCAAGSADAVVCMTDTVLHLPSRAAVAELLRKAAAVLRAGGVLVLSFRDMAGPEHELQGSQRFLQVASSDDKILTCFLEYLPDVVRVHDILHERTAQGWTQRVGWYPKLRLAQAEVEGYLRDAGLAVVLRETARGMLLLAARKP